MIVLSEFGFFFFFKQKTAYEMRISDWSSDVCSSDLARACRQLCAFSFAALQLFAEHIALLLEVFKTRQHRSALVLQLAGELHHLPDSGGERIQILQHGPYRNPSRPKITRKKLKTKHNISWHFPNPFKNLKKKKK